MRKCIRCGNDMIKNCGIRVEYDLWNLVLLSDEKKIFKSKLGSPKVAICPCCGEISFYVENLEKLK